VLACVLLAACGKGNRNHGLGALSGSGTPEDPYVLGDCADLQLMAHALSATFRLGGDIDCAGFDIGDGGGFMPVGTATARFSGALEGGDPQAPAQDRGHVIQNLHIDRPGLTHVGLFGFASGARIERIGLVDVDIVGLAQVGAVAGRIEESVVREVFAFGTVQGEEDVGGFIGVAESESRISDTRCDVFATASQANEGHFLAQDASGTTIERSLSTGSTASGALPLVNVSQTGEVIASFYDCENAGQCTQGVPEARTTSELQHPPFFIGQGWNFSSVWGVRETVGYPCLVWEQGCQPYQLGDFEGTGTEADPYLVGDCGQLQAMSQSLAAHYRLVTDIDCASFDYGDGGGFLPVGSELDPFTGSLDGAGHLIRNLRIERPSLSYVGLFGHIVGATIQTLGLEDGSVEGNDNVALMAGSVRGGSELRSVYATGDVNGNASVAGLAGVLESSAIENAWASANVQGSVGWTLGGIAGQVLGQNNLSGSIRHALSRGTGIWELASNVWESTVDLNHPLIIHNTPKSSRNTACSRTI
jgi:hypothetical protein